MADITSILSDLLTSDKFLNVNALSIASDIGGIATICGISTAIAVVSFSLSLVLKWSRGDIADIKQTFHALFFFTIICAFFFVSSGFTFIIGFIQYGEQQFVKLLFETSITHFRNDILYLLSMIHKQSTSGLDIFGFSVASSTAEMLLLSISLTSLIIILYLQFYVLQLIFSIVILAGPAMAAISFVFPDILKTWGRAAFAAILFPAISGILMLVIAQTGCIRLCGGTLENGWLLGTVVFCFLSFAFVASLPIILSELFGLEFLNFFWIIRLLISLFSPIKWFKLIKKITGK